MTKTMKAAVVRQFKQPLVPANRRARSSSGTHALAAAGTHVVLNGFGEKAAIRGIALPVDGGWTAQ